MDAADPIDEASRALPTAVGSDESTLRTRMGNEGYEAYMRRFNALEDLRVIDSQHHSDQTKGWVAVAAAKASFWRSMSGAVTVAGLLGIAWSAYEMARWA